MHPNDDPFIALAPQAWADDFSALEKRPVAAQPPPSLLTGPLLGPLLGPVVGPLLGRLHGFDLLDQPLISGLSTAPGQVMPARSTVPLTRRMLGHDVLVQFEAGDVQLPIITGVVQKVALRDEPTTAPTIATALVDGERHVIEAEREIVLRCGDASITLTRAGKVIIKGHYILSRASGYNKIKGAAIDIN
jgi:Domain of unknown function (DUF6484)